MTDKPKKFNNGELIPYPCEALVDQGRYIGKVPVGYSCQRPAIYIHPSVDGSTNAFLCEGCAELLQTAAGRAKLTLSYRSQAQRDAILYKSYR